MRSKGLKQARNKLCATRPRTGPTFFQDFAPLEASLASGAKTEGVVITPEHLIAELHLTPRFVCQIERRYRIMLPWFVPAYAILKRHGLMPSARTSWEGWLKRYRKRRAEVTMGN
jgi:hypothetical protein